PETPARPTAAPEDREAEPVGPARERERRADLLLRALALHAGGDHEQLGDRPAPRHHGDDVAQRGAVRTRDHGDAARVGRQGPLARGVEQPVLRERGLRLLERELPQSTRLRRQQVQDGEPELPLLLPHGGAREHEPLHPVLRRRRQPRWPLWPALKPEAAPRTRSGARPASSTARARRVTSLTVHAPSGATAANRSRPAPTGVPPAPCCRAAS